MGLGSLLVVPFANLGLHAAGRSAIKHPKLWQKPGLRHLREFAGELVTRSFKKGLAGKAVKEMPLAIVGAVSPGVSKAVGIAHELGVRGRKMGAKNIKQLEEMTRQALTHMDRVIGVGEKVRKYSGTGGALFGAALGGATGAALTPQEKGKVPYAAIGAALGLGIGGVAGGSLAKALRKPIGALKASRPSATKTHEAVKGFVERIEAPSQSKLVDRLVKIFFEK